MESFLVMELYVVHWGKSIFCSTSFIFSLPVVSTISIRCNKEYWVQVCFKMISNIFHF